MSDKKNLFNSVKVTAPGSNHFDLTHDVKLSTEMGRLTPVMCMECVPGDKVSLSFESLVRFMPLIAPVMHRFDVSIHSFFVPNRILWDGWDSFLVNEPRPGQTNVPAFPTILIDASNWAGLPDYLGIPEPIGPTSSRAVNALPFAGVQCIYNEYYRDQNLVTPVNWALVDGDNSANPDLTVLRYRAWEHDRFTSCLPTAQAGQPVTLPIVDFNDVRVDRFMTTPPVTTELASNPAGDPTYVRNDIPVNDPSGDISLRDLWARTSDLEPRAITINELRFQFRLQEWAEKMMRGGRRIVEVIKNFFGVTSPDKRLQRPEYITGLRAPVVISEVLNTSATATEPQANMAGHGVAVAGGNAGGYFCEEHGFIIAILSITPKTAYQQGFEKFWLKTNSFTDYYWPQFANIGEEEVTNEEVYAYGPDPSDTFGYTPRYSDYKFLNNRVAGEMRTTLNYWHAGRIFASPPALNQTFIECIPDDRIFAVSGPGVDSIVVTVLNKVHAVRPMPKFGTPTF